MHLAQVLDKELLDRARLRHLLSRHLQIEVAIVFNRIAAGI
jgi:hypothetical protein